MPPTAREVFAARLEENRRAHAAWQSAVAALPPEQKTRLNQVVSRQVRADLYAKLRASLDDKADATRAHSGKVIQTLAELVPGLVSGSADLNASTKTDVKASTSVQAGAYQGKNLHFGIREHAMGGIVSGLALSTGFVPVCSTFLVFADYMRPSIRLAALTGLSLAYVFALECAAAWAHAVQRKDGPTALYLTRQSVPRLERPANFDPNLVLRGAYVIAGDTAPHATIVATGSEVGVAVAAKKLSNDKGRQVRVVSAPCWDLFRRQSADYQASVLPKGSRLVTLEAGVTTPWAEAGSDVIRLGIDGFGASGPYKELASAYGLTPEQVADSILKKLA